MAGNKINTKKKDDKSKSSKNADQITEENEDIDFSLLRKPILTSITGFAQARKIFDLATEELKGLLSNECDLLYECKVCRNIFRSLANLISHKRVYCKEKFNATVHGNFFKETSAITELLKIRQLEENYQESLSKITDSNGIEDDSDERIPATRDLTSIVEKITNNKGVPHNEVPKQLVFQKIPKSSVAVYQNVKSVNRENDTMKAQVNELNDILSQENAILQDDGSFKVQSDEKNVQSADTVIQISDDDENEESDVLKCKICELQFSTLKTLKFHIKYKHLENRLVYPCPDCLDIFSTSWSVYRHLFKVHRKTAAQIRRLRESIQAKAFRMNNPPAYYEKRKTIPKTVPTQKITEEERLYKENQAWLEELDGESEGRRCGGCGRAFERRAALAAHTHTCARRHRRRIQIQIRKDYHKEPNNPYLALAGGITTNPADTKSTTEDIQTAEKEEVEKDMKDDNEEDPLAGAELTITDDKSQQEETEEMETDEPVMQIDMQKFYNCLMINKLPFAQQIEKSNLNAFKQKIELDIDIDKLFCKQCDIKYEKTIELLEHMAGHYKWVRYACKLCNFKHFNFGKLPEHVKIVHKLKGNTDFYYSTLKAIDGTEALELSESVEELNEVNETSPDSRRPSRCSSDSSRLSDDSSSSSTRIETGSRKRKCNIYKTNAKKKKEIIDHTNQKDILLGDADIGITKIFEENSSDLEEVEEKNRKGHNIEISSSVASRRPVRKKTKPKNADFEYDLSNLLKMEAQGYRDSQSVCTKVIQGKKKSQQDLQNNYDIINKDCCGAMITLSRKSLENAHCHMKTTSFSVFKTSKESRISSIFARPMIPKITRVDKISPKKIDTEESNDIPSPTKSSEPSSNSSTVSKDLTLEKDPVSEPEQKELETFTQKSDVANNPKDSIKIKTLDTILNDLNKNVKDKTPSALEKVTDELISENDLANDHTETEELPKKASSDKSKKKVSVVPIKFRKQSMEVIKNPLIKKNMTDFTKAGMKTKILVIKPISRSSDGIQNLNTSLKFQTIKLKDPSKSSATNEENKSDQVVVVQVPKVDCGITKPITTSSIVNNIISITNATSNNENEKSKDVLVNYDKTISDNTLENNTEDNNDVTVQNNETNSQTNLVTYESVTQVNEVINKEESSKDSENTDGQDS